ncbi:hypothetical protein [Streptomyces sp. 2P-4]|uniref:hypothetical protein n=1 Tax=Streptomyces sp. 2P-4 TaxID=2931974 RepID=UPI002540B16A|nr:hypothetical protein [Streptomyces sp. 2P-4]
MHTFVHTEIAAGLATRAHAARTAELAAAAAAAHLARGAARPRTPLAPALRARLGEALVQAGTRLLEPVEAARLPTRPA